MALAISFAARHYKIPIIHTFHIVTFCYPRQLFLRRKTELRMTKIVKPALITAPNNYDVKKLFEAGFTQAKLLPNGIDLKYWRQTKLSKKHSGFTFVTAGRLVEQKGYEYLIRATAILKSTHPRIKVIIIGEGAEKKRLCELARSEGVIEQIVFAGGQSTDKVRKAYALDRCSCYSVALGDHTTDAIGSLGNGVAHNYHQSWSIANPR